MKKYEYMTVDLSAEPSFNVHIKLDLSLIHISHIKLILVLPCTTQTKGWSKDDIAVYEAVSYTQLDVYKRQPSDVVYYECGSRTLAYQGGQFPCAVRK